MGKYILVLAIRYTLGVLMVLFQLEDNTYFVKELQKLRMRTYLYLKSLILRKILGDEREEFLKRK